MRRSNNHSAGKKRGAGPCVLSTRTASESCHLCQCQPMSRHQEARLQPQLLYFEFSLPTFFSCPFYSSREFNVSSNVSRSLEFAKPSGAKVKKIENRMIDCLQLLTCRRASELVEASSALDRLFCLVKSLRTLGLPNISREIYREILFPENGREVDLRWCALVCCIALGKRERE